MYLLNSQRLIFKSLISLCRSNLFILSKLYTLVLNARLFNLSNKLIDFLDFRRVFFKHFAYLVDILTELVLTHTTCQLLCKFRNRLSKIDPWLAPIESKASCSSVCPPAIFPFLITKIHALCLICTSIFILLKIQEGNFLPKRQLHKPLIYLRLQLL